MPRFVQNDTDAPMFVAGIMIPPGDGRLVPEEAATADLGIEVRTADNPATDDTAREAGLAMLAQLMTEPENPDTPPPSAEQQAANIADMLTQSVAQLTPLLPTLSAEVLAQLEQAELAGKQRSSLLSAISAETLQRAQQTTGSAPQ